MDLTEQARILRSRWPIIAAVVVVGLLALAIFGRGPAPKYKATAVLVFQETGNPPRDAFVQDLTAAADLLKAVEGKLAASAKAPIDQQEALRAQRDAILRHLQDTAVANMALPPQQTLTPVGTTVVKVEHNRLAPRTVPGWMIAAFVLALLGCVIALIV